MLRKLFFAGDNAASRHIPRSVPCKDDDILKVAEGAEALRELLPIALSTVIEASPELSFIKDKHLQYICCNRAFARATGLSEPKDLIGKTDRDLVPEKYAERYLAEDMQILSSGQPLLEYSTLTPTTDGSVCYTGTSKYPLINEAGEVIGIYGVTRSSAKQHETYRQLKLFNDSIPAGIATFEVSHEGVRVLYVNEGFCRTCGYSKEAYLSVAEQDPFGWILEEDRLAAVALVQDIRSGLLKTGIGCYRCHTQGGGYRWFSLTGTVAERRGDTVIVHAVKYDITEQKLTEEKLAAASARLQLLTESLSGGIATYRISPAGVELTYFNDGYCRLFGMSRSEYAVQSARNPLCGVAAEDCQRLRLQIDSLLKNASAADDVYRVTAPDGCCRWVKCTVAVCGRQGDTVTVNLLLIDISEQYRPAQTPQGSEKDRL